MSGSFAPTPPPRLRSSLPAVDIGGFYEAVDEALTLHLQAVKWPPGTQPTFVHEFPKQRLAKADDPFDVVTVHCGGAEMAPTSNDGSRVPIRPLLREVKLHPDKLGYLAKQIAWKEEAAVVFDIWSRSNQRADDMTVWFHRFLMRYAHVHEFFRARGVDRFQFIKRGEDTLESVTGQEVYRRSLQYQIRIEYLDMVEEKTLETVTVYLNTEGSLRSTEIDLP